MHNTWDVFVASSICTEYHIWYQWQWVFMIYIPLFYHEDSMAFLEDQHSCTLSSINSTFWGEIPPFTLDSLHHLCKTLDGSFILKLSDDEIRIQKPDRPWRTSQGQQTGRKRQVKGLVGLKHIITTVIQKHICQGLPWIFLGAPLTFNGAPRNIQGNLTGMQQWLCDFHHNSLSADPWATNLREINSYKNNYI